MTIVVNADNFARAESDLMFSRIHADAGGANRWNHFRVPAPLDRQTIVRLNRDTLYSACIVDLTEPVVLTVPDAGDRYLSVMVVTQDHFIPKIFHGAGTHRLTREEFGTQYVLLAARILVDPADPSDVAAVNVLQDGLGLESVVTNDFVLPDYDQASQAATREILLRLADGLPDFRGAFGRADEVDPVRHLACTAAGWGGLPDYEATYLNVVPNLPLGEYQLRIVDPPVDAFWSVSLYNAQGFFEPSDLGATNINSITSVKDPDGGTTVRFGVADSGAPNHLHIMEGWNFMVRLYQPRAEVLDGSWQLPEVTEVTAP